MTSLSEFQESLQETQPRPDFSPLLQALWWDAQEQWDKSHDIAQEITSNEGSWMHAYLHRKEGDQFNADYWYRRAGRPRFEGSLQEEWQAMAAAFVKLEQ